MVALLTLLNPTVLVAIAIAGVAGWLGGYVAADLAASGRCKADRLSDQVQVLAQHTEATTAAAEADDRRARIDLHADERNGKAVDETPANPAACLDADAARRVRAVR